MPTPNLNLPLIEGTNTADVVRDLNGLATAVDTSVGEALDNLSSAATDITIADTANYYTSSNVEGALAELGQTLNGTRANLVATAQALGVM